MGMMLVEALLSWGTHDDNHMLSACDGDIEIWFGFHSRTDDQTYYQTYVLEEGKQIVEMRLEVLLARLTKIYPSLWTRTDWIVASIAGEVDGVSDIRKESK